jgi:hypothetical protein
MSRCHFLPSQSTGIGTQTRLQRRRSDQFLPRAILERLEERCLLSTIVVTSNADSGAGSLRAALAAAVSGDTVDFNISGSGVQTIALASPLPAITQAITIDGYSQPGASANTNGPGLADNATIRIQIDATNGFVAFDGGTIKLGTNNATVRGLSLINNPHSNGVYVEPTFTGNIIAGNFIGMQADGVTKAGNVGSGVLIDGDNNTVGGTNPADRNVITGNSQGQVVLADLGTSASNNLIAGNFIGVDATGAHSVANISAGIQLNNTTHTNNNLIGGTTPAARNIISGNNTEGVDISNDLDTTGVNNNVVEGNFIGTDVTGTVAVPNGGIGVRVNNSLNTIGGTASGAGNVIAASVLDGIEINEPNNAILGNDIGTDLSGTINLGNGGRGISINTSNTQIGDATRHGNTIAFNGSQDGFGAGIGVASGTGNTILENSIYSNVGNGTFGPYGLGIDLNNDGVTLPTTGSPHSGPNTSLNFPLITSAQVVSGQTIIQGTLNAVPNTTYRIEYFSSPTVPLGGTVQGKTFLGLQNVTTNGSGDVAIDVTLSNVPPTGEGAFSATATDPAGNTSEFGPNLIPSRSALVVDHNPATALQAVTFTATITQDYGFVTPNGSYTFFDGSTNLGTFPVDGSRQAQLVTSSLLPGTHSITAVYSADASVAASISSAVGEVINGTATTAAVDTSANPAVFGQPVTFTATVSAGSGTPTGMVTFLDGSTVLGTGMLNGLSPDQATFTPSSLSLGLHTISADYAGDSTFDGSSAISFDQQIVQASTATSVVPDVNPSFSGTTVTFTATVAPQAPAAGTPTGMVTFSDGSTVLGTGNLNGSGVAALSTSSLGVGDHSISALYAGDSNFLTSNSTVFTQTISPEGGITPIVTLYSSSIIVEEQQDVVFRAVVVDPTTGAAVSGSVIFADGITQIASATVNSSGQASFSTTALTFGIHHITAAFNEAGAYNYSASYTIAEAVNPFSAISGTSDERFVESLYRDVLHRGAAGFEVGGWVGALNGGMTRQDVALAFEQSVENRVNVVTGMYWQLLHRGTDPQYITWFDALAAGASEDQVEQSILASPEYQNDSPATGRYVDALYSDVLTRAADSGSRASFITLIDTGSGSPRLTVANTLVDSTEAHTNIVTYQYMAFLNRAPDSTALTDFVGALDSGALITSTLAATILGSQEYSNNVG